MSLALAPIDVSVDIEANLPCRKFDPGPFGFSDSPAQLGSWPSRLCGDCPLRVRVPRRRGSSGTSPGASGGGEIFERGAVVPAQSGRRGRPRKGGTWRAPTPKLAHEVEERLAANGPRVPQPGPVLAGLRSVPSPRPTRPPTEKQKTDEHETELPR